MLLYTEEQEIRELVAERIELACRRPEGRLQMRKQFYRKYGAGLRFGHGQSEIDFIGWSIRRGVFDDAHGHGGSRWWKAVNRFFAYQSELAAALFERGVEQTGDDDLDAWLRYLRQHSAVAW